MDIRKWIEIAAWNVALTAAVYGLGIPSPAAAIVVAAGAVGIVFRCLGKRD